MINQKVVIESAMAGILFALVYGMGRFELELQLDGEPVDMTSSMGQFFWYAKMGFGFLASRVASKELAGLIALLTPVLEDFFRGQLSAQKAPTGVPSA